MFTSGLRLLLPHFLISILSANSYAQCSVQVWTGAVDCANNCTGTITAQPTGSAPFTYLWSNGQTTQTATGTCSGACYTVTVTDNNGCSVTQFGCMIATTWANATLITPASCSTCCDGVVDVSGQVDQNCLPVIVMWDNNQFFGPDPITGVCPGVHTYCIWDACGCQVCDSVLVQFTVSDHITTADLPTSYQTLNIYSIHGQLLFHSDLKNNNEPFLPKDQLTPGIYFVVMISDDKQTVKKIILGD